MKLKVRCRLDSRGRARPRLSKAQRRAQAAARRQPGRPSRFVAIVIALVVIVALVYMVKRWIEIGTRFPTWESA